MFNLLQSDGLLFLAALVISFLVSAIQIKLIANFGSDNPVHIFLATVIRNNGHKLFTTIPRLINESHCSAYPLFMHWLLSFLSPARIEMVATYLNPAINILQLVIIYLFLKTSALSVVLSAHAGLVCLLFSLTPQFFHTNSARNHGLSARPVGILLFMVFGMLLYNAGQHPASYGILLAAILTGYLIWGFSTFTQQALILFSVFFLLVFQSWQMLAILCISLLLFVMLHREYAISYLKYTFLFVKAYATELAEVFVLKLRPSLWRDLVRDIWVKLGSSPKSGLFYAYANSVLIVVFLNPLSLLATYVNCSGQSVADPLVVFASRLSLAGLSVAFLTSFRATRFLGEPERYVEMVTAFSTMVAVVFLVSTAPSAAITLLLLYFVILNIVQCYIGYLVRKGAAVNIEDLSLVEQIVNAAFEPATVRFASNNESHTKLLMKNMWHYYRLWSAEQKYAGLSLKESFSVYPFVNKEALEKALQQAQINVCLLDKDLYADIYDNASTPAPAMQVLLETDKHKLLSLTW